MQDYKDKLPPGSKIFTYARDSGHEHQKASCQQQNDVYAKLAREQAWAIAGAFTDEARPGSSAVKRTELARLLDTAKRGAADGILFWSSARLAREVDDAQFFRSTLRRRGYTLIFIADDIPEMGLWTPLFEVAKDIQNAQYLDLLSKEVKRGQAQLVAAGYVPSGHWPPVGYVIRREQYGTHRDGRPREGIRWEIDPELRARVALAWQMRLDGHSYWAVHDATHLLAEGGAYGRLFRRPIYKGTFVWGELVVENFCEPYVTPGEWDRVQAIQDARAAAHPRRLGNKHLLTGLLFCPKCGGPMASRTLSTRASRNVYKYYCCISRYRYKSGCKMAQLRMGEFERAVVADVMAVYSDPERLRRVYTAWQEAGSGPERQADIAALRSALDRGAAEIANLLGLAKLGDFSSVAAELARLEVEQGDRAEKLRGLEAAESRAVLLPLDDLPTIAARLQEAIEQGATETARLYLGKLVSRIDVNPDRTPHLVLRRPSP